MTRVGAIDCGTNSIRLLVADVTVHEDGRKDLRDIVRTMQVVRLGQGVDATGRLAEEAIERTRKALADYARASGTLLAERHIEFAEDGAPAVATSRGAAGGSR